MSFASQEIIYLNLFLLWEVKIFCGFKYCVWLWPFICLFLWGYSPGQLGTLIICSRLASSLQQSPTSPSWMLRLQAWATKPIFFNCCKSSFMTPFIVDKLEDRQQVLNFFLNRRSYILFTWLQRTFLLKFCYFLVTTRSDIYQPK